MDPAAVRDRKRELRAGAQALPIDPGLATAASVRLEALELWASVRSVALYAAWRDEPSADGLARQLDERGVSLAWPTVEDERIVLRLCPLGALVAGYRGIREPPVGSEAVHVDLIDAFVVPGVLFDRRGARLGRGRGHYDRLLSGARSDSLRIGLTVSARLVDAVPVDEWDVPMHRIVTEQGIVEGAEPCT